MSNIKSAKLSATAIALGTIAAKAMVEGEVREQMARAIKAAWSKRNADKVRAEYMAGRIAASLKAKGDNRPDVALIIHGRLVLSMANANGTGKLKKGQTARRSPIEEAAYGAARVAWSSILKAAGVKTFETRGGDRSNTGNGIKKGQGKAKTSKAPANDVSPAKAAPKMKDAGDVNAFVVRQAAVLDAFQRKNAALMSAELAQAVATFYAAVRDAGKAE